MRQKSGAAFSTTAADDPFDADDVAREEQERRRAEAEMLRMREHFQAWLHVDLREMTPKALRELFDRRWTDDRPPCTGRACFVRACEIEAREKFARAVKRTGGDGAQAEREGDLEVLAFRAGQIARAGGSEEAMKAYVDGIMAIPDEEAPAGPR